MLELNKIYLGECLEIIENNIEDKSIDMVLCDLPYTTKKRKITWNTWDCPIDLEALFKQYKRIIKDNGAIVLFAMQPFASQLISVNYDWFKYEWIWEKEQGTGFLNAKRMPLRNHENILVFYKKQPTYNPQMTEGKAYKTTKGSLSDNYCNSDKIVTTENVGVRYPKTIIKFKRDKGKQHPTQKPQELYKYLAETYTNKGEIILDNCCGSGTIKVVETIGRNYIGIEKEKNFFDIATNREIS